MFILGKKIGMTQFFQEDGTVVPVTLIKAGPVTVTQVKTKEKDGYEAVQVGFGKVKKLKKPQSGHLKELDSLKNLKEFRIVRGSTSNNEEKTDGAEFKRGGVLNVSVFNVGDVIKVSGISKGKGFQGVVKRHGFHGMPASHGHHHVMRHGGSIGQRFPQHTLRGMRMPGRMGGVRATTRGLKVAAVDKDKNLLAVKGAVPGRRGTLLEIVKI